MFAPVIGAAYTMTTKREAHWSRQTKVQNTEKGMYVSLKQPRGDGEHYLTPARATAKETIGQQLLISRNIADRQVPKSFTPTQAHDQWSSNSTL